MLVKVGFIVSVFLFWWIDYDIYLYMFGKNIGVLESMRSVWRFLLNVFYDNDCVEDF